MPTAQAMTEMRESRPFKRGLLGVLNANVAEEIAQASGDLALIIDRNGKILDIAASREIANDGAETWLDRQWTDTVAEDSRHKVEELLRDARQSGRTRWREINQNTADHSQIAIRFVAVDTGHDGHIVAIGRDERRTANLQQRLVEAQQLMERDYAKLRDTEYRYRLLFHMSGEAVVIVDAATRRIIEANPAAERLIFGERAGAYGEPFARHFDPECQDDATALLSLVQAAASASANEVRLTCRGRELLASASLFREERTSQFLVRLVPVGEAPPAAPEASARLGRVLESMPGAFVLVDTSARIITANASFVEMVRLGAKEQVEGQPLNRFVGRSGLERDILIDNLRTHGKVRNFNSLLRTHLGDQEDVEISGVFTSEGAEPCFGLSIRPANRLAPSRAPARPGVNRSVEQLTELVGRVPLKELVRESTDLVEKLCIEVALELTRNNRASAADLLGLSRQGLYSKLHKFGLGNLSSDE